MRTSMDKLRFLFCLLILHLSCPVMWAEEEEETDLEFNIGFYYDKEAAEQVKKLGGMEMHAHLCSSQFNQALMSAGIDNVWINPALVSAISYNAKGNTKQALMKHVLADDPEMSEEIEDYELDFVIIFVSVDKEKSSSYSLGTAIELYHIEGLHDADGDYETEWAEVLEDSELEGAQFQIIRTPVAGQPGKVRLTVAYRFLALDLYESLNSFTFVHELGHLFGAGHSKDQNEQRGPASPEATPYAGGAYITLTEEGKKHRYCTVMSYNDASYTDSGHQYIQLPMFSSTVPQQLGWHGEHVLGSEDDDNARAILKSAELLAENRPYGREKQQPSAKQKEIDELPTILRWAPKYLEEELEEE